MLFSRRSISFEKLGKSGIFAILLLFVGSSCATKKPVKVVEEPKVEPAPVCMSGCMLNEDGLCGIEAIVSEEVGATTEFVECDARCCDPNVMKTNVSMDSDGDGIYDSADECPNEPEDYDDHHDKDGCPELDNDGDKILDDDDLCPLDPEDMDGVEDHDGCPE